MYGYLDLDMCPEQRAVFHPCSVFQIDTETESAKLTTWRFVYHQGPKYYY